MISHTLAQALNSIGRTIGRYAWWLGLSLVLGILAFAAYRATTSLAVVSAPAIRSIQAAALNSVLQSMMDYLRIGGSDQPLHAPAAPRDPATQSTLDYIRAHQRVDRPYRASALWAQAMQIVRDYLWAHNR